MADVVIKGVDQTTGRIRRVSPADVAVKTDLSPLVDVALDDVLLAGNSTGPTDLVISTGQKVAGQTALTLEATAGGIVLRSNATDRWTITTAGHLVGFVDNTYDIGSVGAARPRTIYIGTSTVTPTVLGDTTLLVRSADNATLDANGYTLTLRSGDATNGTGSGGDLIIESGLPEDGPGGGTGTIYIRTPATDTFSGGEATNGIFIDTGVSGGDSGGIFLKTGDGVTATGTLDIRTGTSSGISVSGDINIVTGGGYSAGSIFITTGAVGPAGGGNISIASSEDGVVGIAGSGPAGAIQLAYENATAWCAFTLDQAGITATFPGGGVFTIDGELVVTGNSSISQRTATLGDDAEGTGLLLVQRGFTSIGDGVVAAGLSFGPVYNDQKNGTYVPMGNSVYIDGNGVNNLVRAGDGSDIQSVFPFTAANAGDTYSLALAGAIDPSPLLPGSVTIRIIVDGDVVFSEETDDGAGAFAAGTVLPAGGTVNYANRTLTGTTANLAQGSRVEIVFINSNTAGENLVVRSGHANGTASGGDLSILSGNGGATSGDSGDLIIDVGTVVSGTEGSITLGATNATAISIGHAASLIGFYGEAAAAQQAVAALTNSITAGGTDDTLDNYTDLTTYATDAAAIRNNLYQLGRKLDQVVDALRLYGLVG